MSESRRIAAIDIGTVTTRLLIADVTADSILEVSRSTDITHLGRGLTSTGVLSSEAMSGVRDVIAGYVAEMRRLGVEAFTAAATSASRDADNSGQFVDMLASVGVSPRVIPGDEEAALSFAGATFALEGEGILVLDVGGGSTELVLGAVQREDGGIVREIEMARSIDVGSRRVTEMFLHSDPPTASEIEAARAWMTGLLRGYFDGLRSKPQRLVALAGAATTLSAIHLGLEEYDSEVVHGSVLTGSDLAEITDMLARMPLAKRREVAGLHPERAQVIVGGALVIETALALAGLDELTVSEHDILYGILLHTYRDLQGNTG